MPSSGRWALADPQPAVDLLGTLRNEQDALVDDLADEDRATAWLRESLTYTGPQDRTALVRLRELIRELCTAAIDGNPLPAGVLEEINEIAARAPITLGAQIHDDGTVHVQRVSQGTADLALSAELARSALALLADPARLRRCRAPGCILFFLQHDPRQQWCSSSCGNRARVARHYARRNDR